MTVSLPTTSLSITSLSTTSLSTVSRLTSSLSPKLLTSRISQLIALTLASSVALIASAQQPLQVVKSDSGRSSDASSISVSAQLSHPKIWSGEKQTAYLKVALNGREIQNDRAPVNIALVIDRSGSMGGLRMKQAKEAALLTVKMLQPDDIVSLIAYDTKAELIVPATKLGDGSLVRKGIKGLKTHGSTALYAGTQLGGVEVQKFLNRERVNRVILLSDGIANIGPSSPDELAKLGIKLASAGMSVSTIGLGLGYNEDLMARLADASDGNHSFVERPDQLARIMSLELGDALAVVAQDVKVEITLPEGVRPVRALGRDADFKGQRVTSVIKSIIANAERFVLLEVEVSRDFIKKETQVARVEVSYRDAAGEVGRVNVEASAKAASSASDMKSSEVSAVMSAVVELIARERQALAIKLKDEGRDQEALEVAHDNNAYIDRNAKRYKSKKLKKMHTRGVEDAAVIGKRGKGKTWRRARKQMRQEAYRSKAQMAF